MEQEKITKQVIEKIWSASQLPNEPNHSGNELLKSLRSVKNVDLINLDNLIANGVMESLATLKIEVANILLSDDDVFDECKAILNKKEKESSVPLPKSKMVNYAGMRNTSKNDDVSVRSSSPSVLFTKGLMGISESYVGSIIFALLFFIPGAFWVYASIFLDSSNAVPYGGILLLGYGIFLLSKLYTRREDD